MKNTIDKKILDLGDVQKIDPDLDKIKIISYDLAKKSQSIFFDSNNNTLCVLTTNNYPSVITQILDRISAKGYKFEFYYTDEIGFDYALNWYDDLIMKEREKEEYTIERKTVKGKQAIDMIKQVYKEKHDYTEQEFITEIIRLSFQSGASDLHFQPEDGGVTLRLRRDGVLKTVLVFDSNEFRKYMVKLKFMSGVRVNITKAPQDGRFDFISYDDDKNDKKIDVRVSFMPGLRGESVVMRFLDSSKSILGFSQIGFEGDSLSTLNNNLRKNYGMILVTGPTGSGKTTTLYSMLNYLNDPGKKIITLEDPVEYELPGIQQSQISNKDGYDYVDGLKAILRQDPEIIMVGEIRTLETAEIAINAALTGHLVISTLHTNSAIEAVSRLLSMGVKPYMLAPALNLVVGQRLLRKLHSCKSSRASSVSESEEIKAHIKQLTSIKKNLEINYDGNIPIPTGCVECGADGYEGRIAAVETFEVNDDIKKMIVEEKSEIQLLSQARQSGYLTIKDDAYVKMLEGKTTLDEIRRVV